MIPDVLLGIDFFLALHLIFLSIIKNSWIGKETFPGINPVSNRKKQTNIANKKNDLKKITFLGLPLVY